MTIATFRSKPASTKRVSAATEARLISIWGPLGSTGKSTVALNLAHELALLGQKVILLDLDTYAPALNQLLPIEATSAGLAGAARLIRQGRFSTEELERLSFKVKNGRHHFHFLPGLPNSSRWPEITPETVQQLVGTCSQNFDIILADVASSLEDQITSTESPTARNCVTRTAIRLSNQVITILSTTQLSAARYLNAFSQLDELQKTRILVLNGHRPSQQIVSAIRTLTRENVLAHIPADEPAMQLAESQKLPLSLARRKSPAGNAIAALAHKLLA